MLLSHEALSLRLFKSYHEALSLRLFKSYLAEYCLTKALKCNPSAVKITIVDCKDGFNGRKSMYPCKVEFNSSSKYEGDKPLISMYFRYLWKAQRLEIKMEERQLGVRMDAPSRSRF